ncbi:MAG: DNA polymerase III subunit delta [Lachnospiraceae bacterium]|nr:DNA polymerase III subunit delta [Lachnospiraceae bacterium]
MKTLNKDLKEGSFKQMYLLYGEEDYLRASYKKRLTKALSDPEDTMNYSYFDGKDISVPAIIDLAETLPFLAPRRLIVIENSSFFKSSQEELAQYLESACETTYFLFVEKEVDKRTKLFKTVSKKGYAVQLSAQDASVLQSWILAQLGKEGYQITNGAMSRFLLYTGADMTLIENELEKLICYCMKTKEIHDEDVERITIRQIDNKIFEMIDCVANQKQHRALELYYDLLAVKEKPSRILYLITRQFNLMYQAKSLKQRGYDTRSIADRTGLKPYVAGLYISQSEQFSMQRLRYLMEQCCQYEENIKTGRIGDRLAVEMMLIAYSSLKR